MSLMTTLMVSNAVVLRRLKVELQILEQKQKQTWTNASPSTVQKPR